MLKANSDNLLLAGMAGLNLDSVLKAWNDAHVSFSGASAIPSPSGPPFRQIVCGSAVQFDLSDATSGQQIVNVPRLRWSINFAQPTDDPTTGGFTIEIDPVSLVDGRTLNGKPAIGSPSQDDGNSAEQPAQEADAAAAEATQQADSAAQAAQETQSDFDAAGKPDPDSKQDQQPNKAPSEDDLYAPHGN